MKCSPRPEHERQRSRDRAKLHMQNIGQHFREQVRVKQIMEILVSTTKNGRKKIEYKHCVDTEGPRDNKERQRDEQGTMCIFHSTPCAPPGNNTVLAIFRAAAPYFLTVMM